MCRAMGVAVVSAFDVGVAGLHRLATPLDEMRAAGVAAVVVARRHGGRSAVGGRRSRRRAGDRPADLHRLRPRRPRRGGSARHAAELQPGPRGGQHRQRHRRRRDGGAHRAAAPPREDAPAHPPRPPRGALAGAGSTPLADVVDSDYRELVASQLGERMLRTLIDDLVAFSEAEQYERPGLLRAVEERTTADARHRLSLGFAAARHRCVASAVLRGAIRRRARRRPRARRDAVLRRHARPAEGPWTTFLDRLVCADLTAA